MQNQTGLPKTLLWGDLPNYLHPFTPLCIADSREDVERRMLRLKAAGVRSMNLLWSGQDETGGFTPFNSEAYWTRILWVAELCEREGMTFMMQDAAPFPTGLADGLLMRPEHTDKNKLYLGERHLDVVGPNAEGAFLVSELVGSIRCTDQEKGFGKARPFAGDALYAVVAVSRASGELDFDTAIDLTDSAQDGLLLWPVPEGIWRIFVIFETRNDGGRMHYINLLDPESVALNIKAIYEPHCAHLKHAIGKAWLGFFYDEPEIGNLWRYCTPVLPGATRNMEGESMALPWSALVRDAWCEAMGAQFRRVLPLLWQQDASLYHSVRARFMDVVSRVVRQTYNGQMHAWCRVRGLQYIGHCLEDENTHASLATGPAHFFRMQAHQDAAGIDLIGGQLMPGKDFPHSWYGNPDGDGEFYHYGIAKLASSAAHIAPNKRGRSFCEVFAVYGDIAGTRIRKFVYDHLLVNGINEMIPAPPFIPGADAAHCRKENKYVNRLCHLMHRTKPVIRAAVLYHAEAEWYGGAFDRFQAVGKVLAQRQISYDVIPADVFEDVEFYRSELSDGLSVNGNRYDALIVPRAEAVPRALADYLRRPGSKPPVLFCGHRPKFVAETGERFACDAGRVVAMDALADALEAVLDRDFALSERLPGVRYARFSGDEGEYYLVVNQGDACAFELTLRGAGALYDIDAMEGLVHRLPCVARAGCVSASLTMDALESRLLLVGACDADVPERPAVIRREGLDVTWRVTLADGTALVMRELANINAKDGFPRYTGSMIYEAEIELSELPAEISLGDVYEIAELFVNGASAGSRQNAPYTYDVRGRVKPGANKLRIELLTGRARDLNRQDSAAFGRSMSATVYNSLEPGGLMGPVRLHFTTQ